jgi:hypothetical protein
MLQRDFYPHIFGIYWVRYQITEIHVADRFSAKMGYQPHREGKVTGIIRFG